MVDCCIPIIYTELVIPLNVRSPDSPDREPDNESQTFILINLFL